MLHATGIGFKKQDKRAGPVRHVWASSGHPLP